MEVLDLAFTKGFFPSSPRCTYRERWRWRAPRYRRGPWRVAASCRPGPPCSPRSSLVPADHRTPRCSPCWRSRRADRPRSACCVTSRAPPAAPRWTCHSCSPAMVNTITHYRHTEYYIFLWSTWIMYKYNMHTDIENVQHIIGIQLTSHHFVVLSFSHCEINHQRNIIVKQRQCYCTARVGSGQFTSGLQFMVNIL